MPKFVDLTGQRFGKLTVLERAPNIGKHTAWKCKCDCGNIVVKEGTNLKQGHTKSCGCDWPQRPKDEVGNKYGLLTVLRYSHNDNHGNKWWVCKCDCGKETVTNGCYLRNGDTRSCGCLLDTARGSAKRTHGESSSRLYGTWMNMKWRCTKGHGNYTKNYGDRGIRVCDEWLNNFSAFRDWAYANGYDENAPYGQCTIDRIDVNGNYEPSNCRWVTMKEQANNTRRNIVLEFQNERHTVPEWANLTGISARIIRRRLSLGWGIKETLTTPILTNSTRRNYR